MEPDLQSFYSYDGKEWTAGYRSSDVNVLVRLAQERSEAFARYDRVRDLEAGEDVATFLRGRILPNGPSLLDCFY